MGVAGRPKTLVYDKDVHPILAEQYAREGQINKEIAASLGISTTTFYTWRKQHDEFCAALKEGKTVVDAKVEKALLTGALSGNFNAQRYWLNNRRPDRWREKSEVEHSGEVKIDDARATLLARLQARAPDHPRGEEGRP